MDPIAILSLILVLVLVVGLVVLKKKSAEIGELKQEISQTEVALTEIKEKYARATERIGTLQEDIAALEKYQGIVDVDKVIGEKRKNIVEEKNRIVEAIRLKTEAIKEKIRNVEAVLKKKEIISGETALKKIQDTNHQVAAIIARSKNETDKLLEEQKAVKKQISAQLKEANKKREEIFKTSSKEAEQIVQQARERAESIAGEAVQLAGKEDQLSKAIQAMKNTIEGYGEQYIIPPFSLLDELAAEYDFTEAGLKLKEVRTRIKMMVKHGNASTCEYVERHRQETAIRFVLDAFNGKVDTILSKVKHDNYGKLKQQIDDAYAIVNINGAAFRNARIKADFLTARLEELRWATAAHELRLQDREEQRQLKEEMREEARAKKEYEKAIKEAEKEERFLQNAMKEARRELASASDVQKAEFEAQLRDLQEKLQIAEEKNQRALSMAQQTRKGHVYVISNEGSFGDSVVKIGLTRRLDPMDRVKELGDASVPFPFDVHAIMYSDDSPALERELHRRFNEHRVNKINLRKEFFKTTIAEVREITDEAGIETKWTMASEAREYRESASIVRAQEKRSMATA